MRIYATPSELAAYGAPTGVVLPTGSEATRQLTRASELLDEVLISTVYDTDPDTLLPTDPVVTQAFRDAVCAQVVAWTSGGIEESGLASQWSDVAIGSVRLARGNSNPGAAGVGAVGRLAPQAVTHLRIAGLLGGVHQPLWGW